MDVKLEVNREALLRGERIKQEAGRLEVGLNRTRRDLGRSSSLTLDCCRSNSQY